MDGVPVTWTWDAAGKTWVRNEYGEAHMDNAGAPVNTANVVVQFVNYRPSPADRRSPEAVTVGEGDAWIFTDGKLTFARWSRPDPSRPAVVHRRRREAGPPEPGRTWIELAEAGVTPVGYA